MRLKKGGKRCFHWKFKKRILPHEAVRVGTSKGGRKERLLVLYREFAKDTLPYPKEGASAS